MTISTQKVDMYYNPDFKGYPGFDYEEECLASAEVHTEWTNWVEATEIDWNEQKDFGDLL